MVTFREVLQNGLLWKKYTCAFCSEEYKFCSVSPYRCLICNKLLPDILDMYEEADSRIKYHISEENTNG